MSFDVSALNKPQQEAVSCTEGPLLILAGAGSGKTKVLTMRTAYLISELGVSPYRILCLTFTNKAAKEMRERIGKAAGEGADKIWIHTFHGFCARILSSECERLGYRKGFLIYDTDDQQSLISTIIKDLGINDKMFSKRVLQDTFSKAKNYSTDPEQYIRDSYAPRQVIDAYREYQKRLKAANAMDFDDLLLKLIELFENCPDVLESYRDLFRYIMVDEYQDTNMAQYKIVSLLAKNHRNICVVGDDDQSIYGWRGADIRNILEFEKDFPGAHVVRLEQNYRSSAKILEAANRVICHNTGRKDKTLWTDRTESLPVTLYEAKGEREEAVYIAERILNGKRNGKRFDEYAVLYRTHAQSRIIEMILQSYAIPYKVYGGTSFFARSEVKDIISYLRIICNAADNISLARIVNVPKRNIGAASLEELRKAAEERDLPLFSVMIDPEGISPKLFAKFYPFTELIESLFALYDGKSVSSLIESVVRKTGYEQYLKTSDPKSFDTRWENVKELAGFAKDFERDAELSDDDDMLQMFLNTVSLYTTTDNMESDDGFVNLMTMHTAKGLEFDTVFLCGLEEGVFPSNQSRTEPEKLEEERRLCYVGITRARNKLYLTYADCRSLFGQFNTNPPSRFLEEMGDSIERPALPQTAEQSSVKHGTAVAQKHEPYAAPKKVEGTKPVQVKLREASKTSYADGDRVRHMIFGEGEVTAVEGSGSTQILNVKFKNGMEKRFSAAYTPLTKL